MSLSEIIHMYVHCHRNLGSKPVPGFGLENFSCQNVFSRLKQNLWLDYWEWYHDHRDGWDNKCCK